jgi:hypothetical protein
MRTRVLVVLVLLLSAGACFGQDEAKPPEKSPDEPDHLVPLDPYPYRWKRRYMRLCREKLQIPREPGATVMVYMPSFVPEECLVVHESEGERSSFTLIHTRADKNIYYSMPENNGGKRERVAVTRREATLPPELAGRVCRVWDRMLRGIRYPIPDEENRGDDGVTIEFWRHRMFGKTWSPTGGAPRLLVELGRSLIAFCDAPEEKRPGALKDVEMRCRALERYLDKEAAG